MPQPFTSAPGPTIRILPLRPAAVLNPQDSVERRDRALAAASVGKVDSPRELGDALRLGWLGWWLAQRRGDDAAAEWWLRVQTEALALLPELRRAHPAIDGAAHSIAEDASDAVGDDPTREAPGFVR